MFLALFEPFLRLGLLLFGTSFGARLHPFLCFGELLGQPLPIRKLPQEGIGIGPVARISPFGLLHALPDLLSELLFEGFCTIVAHAFVDAGVRVALGAVHADRPHSEKLELHGPLQDLKKGLREGLFILPPKGADRVVIGVGVGGNEPGSKVTIRGPFDPAGRKDPLRIAVDQKGEHEPWVVLGGPAPRMIGFEGRKVHSLYRLEDEVGDVVFRKPIAKVGGKEKKLFVICFNEGRHEGLLWFGVVAVQERFMWNSESSKGFGLKRLRGSRPKPLEDSEPGGERERTGGRGK